MISRSANTYLQRHGILDEPYRPGPRLDIAALLVHVTPLTPPRPAVNVLQSLEGNPIPDRAGTRPWPGDED